MINQYPTDKSDRHVKNQRHYGCQTGRDEILFPSQILNKFR